MRRLILFILIAVLSGCTFSKKNSSTIDQQIKKTEKENASKSMTTSQRAVFELAYSDLQTIKTKLSSFTKEDLNSKNANGQTLTDVLIEIGDTERLKIFSAAGLSIYNGADSLYSQIYANEILTARRYLGRLSEEALDKIPEAKKFNDSISRYIEETHLRNIQQLINDLATGNSSDAVINANNIGITCKVLYPGITLGYIASDKTIPASVITQFLQKMGCDGSVASLTMNQTLLRLEMQREFQIRFRDRSLATYLAKTLKGYDAMVSLGSYGVKVSPGYIIKVAHCEFFSENISKGRKISHMVGNNDYEEYRLGSCTFRTDDDGKQEPLENGPTYDIEKFPPVPHDLIVIKDNREFAAIPEAGPRGEAQDAFDSQVIAYMFGFDDNESDWINSLDRLLCRDPIEDM